MVTTVKTKAPDNTPIANSTLTIMININEIRVLIDAILNAFKFNSFRKTLANSQKNKLTIRANMKGTIINTKTTSLRNYRETHNALLSG
jgi:hypothetical protein